MLNIWRMAKEAIDDSLVEEVHAPARTTNTRDNSVPGKGTVFFGSTNNITSNDIWQFCLNIVISIFCWPLYLLNPNSVI